MQVAASNSEARRKVDLRTWTGVRSWQPSDRARETVQCVLTARGTKDLGRASQTHQLRRLSEESWVRIPSPGWETQHSHAGWPPTTNGWFHSRCWPKAVCQRAAAVAQSETADHYLGTRHDCAKVWREWGYLEVKAEQTRLGQQGAYRNEYRSQRWQ